MRKFLQNLLTRPVVQFANRVSSRPDKRRVDKALSGLYEEIKSRNVKKGLLLPVDSQIDKFIILSDQHKGARDGADVFAKADKNYLAALDYYNKEHFFYINLGDSEELWENLFVTVKRHNKATFESEKKFIARKSFIKIFGNHDLYWDNDPLAAVNLQSIYGQPVDIHEGVILEVNTANKKPLEIYMTHGHQGDLQSDGNWFSKWFVSDIWGPFQAYLRINPNTPANNDQLKTDHNRMMYEWSSKRKDTLLITGHTHQPVFRSLTQLELLYEGLRQAKAGNRNDEAATIQNKIDKLHLKASRPPDFKGYLDTYFNSGCCCFDDGDITGIEIAEGCIRLIKWEYGKGKKSERSVLEESRLEDLKLK
ncbi:metallophosphoesterase family protein [Mucilaginibacter sp. BJC16-A38]|uniref:metallophosphoesterase n=1 Tax=Mucilaginibacter phenanthrenivorans TaxID=1234842 RepID=UPI0021581C1E|nr:metallophosphoesterase [Mucilaginibacter phenanthrenivorans]MCR8561524.1 metallophosphoesterase family protein [Mucilaginibacter phenanthrenivorans]